MVRIVYNGSSFQRIKGLLSSPYFGPVTITLFLLFTIPAYILLTRQSQDNRQQASSVSKTGIISVSPATGTFALNQQFNVNIVINGGGQAFNTTSANILVSPNLIKKGLAITSLTNGGCNMIFSSEVKTPTLADPSFSGAVETGSLPMCTLYTLTLQAVSSGTATISIQNGTMKDISENDIFNSTQDGIYTITPR